MAANYPKGHGAWLHAWLKRHYPGILLFHVKSTHGILQDIIYRSSLAINLNRLPNIEFLEHAMCVPGNQHKIIQRNIYVLLTSDEMVAQSFLIAIVYLSSRLPLWWLAGKTHTLWKYNWGARSMGRALDLFQNKLLKLHETPRLFLSDMFMMMLFTEL